MDTGLIFTFDAEVFAWDEGPGPSWRFARLPLDVADELRATCEPGGWGSIRVHAKIGETRWDTSVFPEKASGSYLLPVKAAVRKAEGIDGGDTVEVALVPA